MFAGCILQQTRENAEPRASPAEAAHAANFESCDAVPSRVANQLSMKIGVSQRKIRRPLPTAGGARQRRDSKQWGPWPAGPVRPSGPCCFAVARAPFVSFVGGWKTATASFLVGSESNVRYWGAFPAGPVRPSGPCCFAVARAPFVSLPWRLEDSQLFFSLWRGRRLWAFLGGWKTASFLVGSESNVRHWGPLPAGPSVPQGPAVSLWRGRRLWASLAAGRQLVFL